MFVTIKAYGHNNLPVGLSAEVVREIDSETVFIRTAQVSKAIAKRDLNYFKAKPNENISN